MFLIYNIRSYHDFQNIKTFFEKLIKVEKAMYHSIQTESRKAIKTGPSEYLEALQQLLTELFYGKGLLFSAEKIN